MSHDIEQIAYSLDQYGRGVPWHGLGTAIQGGMSITEALRAVPELAAPVTAWDLEAVAPDGRRIKLDESHPLGKMVANVREPVLGQDGVKPEAALGVVSGSYTITQTAELWGEMEAIVGQEGLVAETAMSLRGGRVNAILLRRPETVQLVGDDVVPYLLVANSYDGSTAVSFTATPIRVVCANTLRAALSTANRTISIRHTGKGFERRRDDIRRALGISYAYIEGMRRDAERLATTRLTYEDVMRIFDAVLPMPEPKPDGQQSRAEATRVRQRAELRALYESAENLDEHRGTAWGVLQAAIEYDDHHRVRLLDPAKHGSRARERQLERVALEESAFTTATRMAIKHIAGV